MGLRCLESLPNYYRMNSVIKTFCRQFVAFKLSFNCFCFENVWNMYRHPKYIGCIGKALKINNWELNALTCQVRTVYGIIARRRQ